jgi:uncharacterized protein YndB with AHSA1/START domain
VNHFRAEGGPALTFESFYRDIVPDERIIYSSTLSAGNDVVTVSVTTVELSTVELSTVELSTVELSTVELSTVELSTVELSTVELSTVEFGPDHGNTRLVLTEQGTFLDGREEPDWRKRGTGDWLDALDADLREHR